MKTLEGFGLAIASILDSNIGSSRTNLEHVPRPGLAERRRVHRENTCVLTCDGVPNERLFRVVLVANHARTSGKRRMVGRALR